MAGAMAGAMAKKKISGRWALLLLLSVVLGGVAGCSPYRLQGIVIEGDRPGIEVVGQDDPRLEYFGLPGAEVSVTLDPEKLSSKAIGRATSDGDGRFAVPISESGAGFLIYDVEVGVSREGFVGVREFLELPGANRRLVVTVKAGQDRGKKSRETYLEETMREAKPYLGE